MDFVDDYYEHCCYHTENNDTRKKEPNLVASSFLLLFCRQVQPNSILFLCRELHLPHRSQNIYLRCLTWQKLWFFALDAIAHCMCQDVHSMIQVRVSYSFDSLRKYFNRHLKKYVLTFHFSFRKSVEMKN